MKKIILVFIMGIILINFVCANSSNLFIDYLTDKIYKDCYGHDLNIKEPFIQNTLTNSSVTLISWPYDKMTLRRVIELFGTYEPFNDYMNGCFSGDKSGMSVGKDGCNILNCSKNKLDINKYTYSWNNERIDVPREEFNTYNGDYVSASGEGSQACVGEKCRNTQFNFKLAFGITLSVAILEFGIIVFEIIRKVKNKINKQKSKNSKINQIIGEKNNVKK